MVGTYLALSLMEELGFRGYPLRTLVPTLGPWRAQAIVAVAFALSHIGFGWPLRTVLFGVLPNALLFGAAALASRGLAMPIGLHAALNISRWAVGETDVSGFWTLTVAESGRDRVATSAPFIGIGVTVVATISLWGWYLRYGALPRRGQAPG
jgi:membrane protease YdiL (CAAX protease family)